MSAALESAVLDPACALCGSRERRTRFKEGEHAIVTCTECDLTYVTPRMTAELLLSAVYDADYWHSARPRERGYADYLADRALHERTFRRRWRGIRRHAPRTGRALDLGCADGAFLAVLREVGWQVQGVEPTAMAAAARERLGDDAILQVPIELLRLPDAHYDLITLWDVLEHLPDPVACLKSAREWLRPDGLLVLETQDVRSFAARVFGRRWHHYKHAEHLHHFHADTLKRALRESGFEIVERRRGLAGKHVRGSFVAERAARVSPALSRALHRLLPADRALYVNLFDELIVTARPR
ncbi:MAG: class I SAM-dependent methyltransferase [Planctomycetes bacterium]|nr:class I SAM-dependent methyltransferase [Planctomycetota bacterium]MCB9903611.1 class I SAM-dependent methyltransferase [Planctomycetota bacterium]